MIAICYHLKVKLKGREHFEPFHNLHKDAKAPLEAWEKLIKAKDYKHYADLKNTFGSADYVKPHTVFDIAGNKYRLISLIVYPSSLVSVEDVLTHKEYDKGKWRK